MAMSVMRCSDKSFELSFSYLHVFIMKRWLLFHERTSVIVMAAEHLQIAFGQPLGEFSAIFIFIWVFRKFRLQNSPTFVC